VSARSRISGGLLLFRRRNRGLEFLLAHPGGPFFAKKDLGCWTIPKGEAAPGEDLLTRAQIEFAEEVGCAPPDGSYLPLGSIQQKGGKIVHAWAVEGDLPDDHVHCSNTFQLEWPPRSGKLQEFPEVDRAEFFSDDLARLKIKPAQVDLLTRALALVG
jgi:predicted NUDIX family NTP pyrophosphohydrolase